MIRDRLRTDIVNELRTRGFVPSSSVVQWRRMISSDFHGNDFNGNCKEQGIDEFLNFLGNALDIPPILQSADTATASYSIQLLISATMRNKYMTLEDLILYTEKNATFHCFK